MFCSWTNVVTLFRHDRTGVPQFWLQSARIRLFLSAFSHKRPPNVSGTTAPSLVQPWGLRRIAAQVGTPVGDRCTALWSGVACRAGRSGRCTQEQDATRHRQPASVSACSWPQQQGLPQPHSDANDAARRGDESSAVRERPRAAGQVEGRSETGLPKVGAAVLGLGKTDCEMTCGLSGTGVNGYV